MDTRSLKILFCVLVIGIQFGIASLHAQTLPLGPYTYTGGFSFGVDANGLLSDAGTYGTGSLSLSGAGTRMIWYPGKAAFRAGVVSGTDWNDANIGHYSVAFGADTMASGDFSFAEGLWSTASGPATTALGQATAAGFYSTAVGNGAATFDYAFAAGCSTASGWGSTAFGANNLASGQTSVSMGEGTIAHARSSVALGEFNLAVGDAVNWLGTDPVLQIGNGTDNTHRSDVVDIYKNGSAVFQGAVSVAPGGDIPMYGH